MVEGLLKTCAPRVLSPGEVSFRDRASDGDLRDLVDSMYLHGCVCVCDVAMESMCPCGQLSLETSCWIPVWKLALKNSG